MKMPSTVRLTKEEQEEIREKCIEINKLLTKEGREPVRDSELVHKILGKTIPYVTVDRSGEIIINIK